MFLKVLLFLLFKVRYIKAIILFFFNGFRFIINIFKIIVNFNFIINIIYIVNYKIRIIYLFINYRFNIIKINN